jgi:hypothetical protein
MQIKCKNSTLFIYVISPISPGQCSPSSAKDNKHDFKQVQN